MAESLALNRIDAAISRIEAAADSRRDASDRLHKRHAALKSRMVEAIAALDEVLVRGEGENA